MSIFPCEVHGKRVKGALESYRITTLDGPDSLTRRARVCALHRLEAMEPVVENLVLAEDGEDEFSPTACAHCGVELDEFEDNPAVFVWSYPRGQEPLVYFGQLHRGCQPAYASKHMLHPNRGRFEPSDQTDEIEAESRKVVAKQGQAASIGSSRRG